MAFVKPAVEHWLEQEISQWVHHEGTVRQPITPRADTLPLSYISVFYRQNSVLTPSDQFFKDINEV